MSPALWMLTGAAALLVVSVLIGMAIDELDRRDVAAALLGAIALPFMVPATLLFWIVKRGDLSGRALSPRTLKRFADQRQREDIDRMAWMFSLVGRGVIVVRKAPRPAAARHDGPDTPTREPEEGTSDAR